MDAATVTYAALRGTLESLEAMLQSDARVCFSSEDQANVRAVLDARLPSGRHLPALDGAQPVRTLSTAPTRKMVRDRVVAARHMTTGSGAEDVSTGELDRMVGHLAEFFVCAMPSARDVDGVVPSGAPGPRQAAVVGVAADASVFQIYLEAASVELPESLRKAVDQGDVCGTAVAFASVDPAQRTPSLFVALVSALAAGLPAVLRPELPSLLNVDARHHAAVQRLVEQSRPADFGAWRGEPRGAAAADFVDGCSALLVRWVDLAACYRVVCAQFRRAVEGAAPNLRLETSVDATIARAAQVLGEDLTVAQLERRAVLTLLGSVALMNAIQWRTMCAAAAVARRDQLHAARLGEDEDVTEFVARLAAWQRLAHPTAAFGARDVVEHLADHQRAAVVTRFVDAVLALATRLGDEAQGAKRPAAAETISSISAALGWWRAERTPTLDALAQRWSADHVALFVAIVEEALLRERAVVALPPRGRALGAAALGRGGTSTPSRSPSPAPALAPPSTGKRGLGPSQPSCFGCGRGHLLADCELLDKPVKEAIVRARAVRAKEREERIAAEVQRREATGKPPRAPTPGPGKGSAPRRK